MLAALEPEAGPSVLCCWWKEGGAGRRWLGGSSLMHPGMSLRHSSMQLCSARELERSSFMPVRTSWIALKMLSSTHSRSFLKSFLSLSVLNLLSLCSCARRSSVTSVPGLKVGRPALLLEVSLSVSSAKW